MFDKCYFNRRAVLSRGSMAAVAGALLGGSQKSGVCASDSTTSNRVGRLPREVAIATITQDRLRATTPKQMIQQMLERLKQVVPLEPDVVCLPELFPFSNVDQLPVLSKVAESQIGEHLERFARFAAEHRCYVIAPVYTLKQGKIYNSAVFLNRQGEKIGEYSKSCPTISEMEAGVCVGSQNVEAIETDIGKIGAQICFDIEWDAGWKQLKKSGAEIVFWPSAFPGGRKVNARAWQNQFCVVSSTNKGISKIVDIDGTELAASNFWQPWAFAKVNLEKALLHTWPYVQRFGDVIAKYGTKVRITTHADEEWSILESRDPEVKIASLLKEFEMLTLEQHLKKAQTYREENDSKS